MPNTNPLLVNSLLIVSTSPCFTGGLERFVEKWVVKKCCSLLYALC